jgi:hypothetical protein
MRQIKTETGNYKIADSRNLEDFVKQLKKPKSLAKRFKAEKRVFPHFISGETSARQYVEAYYRLNNLNRDNSLYDYVKGLFGELSSTPAPDQPVEDETIEVSVCS